MIWLYLWTSRAGCQRVLVMFIWWCMSSWCSDEFVMFRQVRDVQTSSWCFNRVNLSWLVEFVTYIHTYTYTYTYIHTPEQRCGRHHSQPLLESCVGSWYCSDLWSSWHMCVWHIHTYTNTYTYRHTPEQRCGKHHSQPLLESCVGSWYCSDLLSSWHMCVCHLHTYTHIHI